VDVILKKAKSSRRLLTDDQLRELVAAAGTS